MNMTNVSDTAPHADLMDFAFEHLQQMPVFGGINESVLKFMLNKARVVEFDKGEHIIREGDKASSMFVLAQGAVAVVRDWQGREHVLSELAHGDCFGEMSIMDLMPRCASIVAITACKVIEIPNTCFAELYDHDREQFTMFQMNMGREVSRRLRESEEILFQYMMDNMSTKDSAPT